MRITTRAVYQMTDDGMELLERDSYEYDGPVALAGGGGGDTIEQTNAPPGFIKKPLKELIPDFMSALQGRIEGDGFQAGPSAIPGFDPLQLQSQALNQAFAMSPALAGQIGGAQDALGFSLGLPQNIADSPIIAAQIEAAQRPVTQQFENVVMPAIAARSVGSGGFGGSRQGVAEGLAAQGLTQELGDISSRIQADAFSDALTNQQRALAMAPQTLGLGLTPGNILGDIGAQRQALAGQQMGEARGDFLFEQAQNDPFGLYQQGIASLLNPNFGGVQTAPNPNQASSAAQGLGGAITGGMLGNALSAGTMLGAGPAAFLGPAGLAGALIGGGLGLFG